MPETAQWRYDRRELSRAFGKRLQALRNRAGISQTSASELLACSVSTWRSWERGAQMPHPARISAIAAALDVPAEALTCPDDCAPLATFIVGPESLRRLQGPERAQALDELTALMTSQLRSLLEQARPVVVPQKATRARPRRSREQVLADLKRRPKPRREIT